MIGRNLFLMTAMALSVVAAPIAVASSSGLSVKSVTVRTEKVVPRASVELSLDGLKYGRRDLVPDEGDYGRRDLVPGDGDFGRRDLVPSDGDYGRRDIVPDEGDYGRRDLVPDEGDYGN